jgi:hypothetical protein
MPILKAAGLLTRYGSNPVLLNGPEAYDFDKTGPSCVVKVGPGDYRQWYEGLDFDNLGPSGEPYTLPCYATSTDGFSWTKYASNPIMDGLVAWEDDEASPVSVLWDPDAQLWKMWYHGGNNSGTRSIGYATSTDGISWTKYGSNPVLVAGAGGSWEEAWVADGKVIRLSSTDYRMWYGGVDVSLIRRFGYATSSDGISWTKYGSNPVFGLGASGTWDDGHLMAFSPIYVANADGALFHAWYVARDAPTGGNSAVGYAWSQDGISWTRGPNNPVMSTISGDDPEDSIHVIEDAGRFRVFYGQYNLGASPVLRGKGEASISSGGGSASLGVHKGSFALNTGTGNQAITGVGFQPKAIIVYVTNAVTNDTVTAHSSLCVGVGRSSSDRGCVTARSDDAAATMDTARGNSTSKLLRLFSDATGPALDCEVDLVSLDTDGFTINVTDAPAAAYVVHYIALGGAAITDLDVFTFNVTNTATQDVSLAFRPDMLLLLTDGGVAGDAAHAQMCFGCVGSDLSQGATYFIDDDAAVAAIAKIWRREDSCLLGASTGTGTTERLRSRVTARTNAGFTLTHDVQSTVGELVIGLAVKGGRYQVVHDTQRTSTGTKAKAASVGVPRGLLMFSNGEEGSVSLTRGNPNLHLGAATGIGLEAFLIAAGDDGAGTSNTWSLSDTGKAIAFWNAVTQVLIAEADLASLDVGGYTLDWTTADAAARSFSTLVMGDEPSKPRPSVRSDAVHRRSRW